MTLPEGKYGAILADPPWSFLTYGKKRTTPHRTAVDHYQTMTHADLVALPVASAAAKDCALLGQGYGVEDISLKLECSVADVRREVEIYRQEGRIKAIVRGK